MGTKNNPAPYDCYANAEPDEPMFILLARDSRAAILVDLWASMSLGGWRAALAIAGFFWALLRIAYQREPSAVAKVAEARYCATQMRAWRESRERIRRHFAQ